MMAMYTGNVVERDERQKRMRRLGHLSNKFSEMAAAGADLVTDPEWEEFRRGTTSEVSRSLYERSQKVKADKARAAMIAECTGPLDPNQDSRVQVGERTNRLLAAILEALHAGPGSK